MFNRRGFGPNFSDINEVVSEFVTRLFTPERSLGIAVISFMGLEDIINNFGMETYELIVHSILSVLEEQGGEKEVVAQVNKEKFHWYLVDTNPKDLKEKLNQVAQILLDYPFTSEDIETQIDLTPIIGYALYPPADSINNMIERAELANLTATANLDFVPIRYTSSMDDTPIEKLVHWVQEHPRQPIFRLVYQILIVVLIGWVAPYYIYGWFDNNGQDITKTVYIILVISMLITSLLIWIEGILAVQKEDPPVLEDLAFPPASAIIAAYLPNESNTIVETLNYFLNLEYPNDLQIILAYNTPKDLPIEKKLRKLEKSNPRLKLLRVEGSTSKAQNVNQALEIVTGEFIGVFDADHHPRIDSFSRAWRWLSSGYDIVQGHCLVRNGHTSWLSRLIAVEFEALYAVSHPGRAKLHQFAVFGGSNGYWKKDVIDKTRMHGYMLTEDIDSSIRVIKNGYKIRSAPQIISSELAPVNFKALLNQRLRWSQGWHQVSKSHLLSTLISKKLSLRQKFGMFWLLGWREIYPWISIQMYPLIYYWIVKYNGAENLDWLIPIFVVTTIFTLSVGPGQTFLSYKLADESIKTHKKWFIFYFFASSIFYTEFKNWVGRIAQIKELMGEKTWNVTPRDLMPPTR